MDPNQQPNQQPTPQVPQPEYTVPQPVPPAAQPSYPQPPSTYQAPAAPQPYDPNYLDSIAPPPPRGAFLSGSFGKIFFALIAVFVVIVSFVIVSSGGKDKTADLQQISTRMGNFVTITTNVQKKLKSNDLSSTNINFKTWLTGNQTMAEDLLKQAGTKKAQYDKKMVASEKQLAADLDAKFEDARLNATLNRVYASTMAAETDKLVSMLNTMAKKSGSAKIREFAKNASDNLKPIQKSFADYDDGN